jgi:hypothetical protein
MLNSNMPSILGVTSEYVIDYQGFGDAVYDLPHAAITTSTMMDIYHELEPDIHI